MKNWLNVLSLFDWMSVWMLALKEAWIKVDNYFASEIDKNAIQVSKKNHPEIKHIWDVTKVSHIPSLLMRSEYEWRTIYFDNNIDLLIGWSPCQWFSRAWKWLNFEDIKSKLFFEYVRILKETNPKYFFLENVNMKEEWQNIITWILWVGPVKINSKLFTAQNRPRTYWTNIPFDQEIIQKEYKLSDYLDQNVDEKYYINENLYNSIVLGKKEDHLIIKNATKTWFLKGYPWDNVNVSFPNSKTRRWRVKKNMIWCLTTTLHEAIIMDDLRIRLLTPEESERLQWLPTWYTEWVSANQRQFMIWNGWTTDVITHIFKGLK